VPNHYLTFPFTYVSYFLPFDGEPFLEIDAKGGEILGESVRGRDALWISWGKGEANKISHLYGVCKDRIQFGIFNKDHS
jgi:hypothetical protein